MELIYCGAGNKKYADIAVKEGFHFGAQLPGQVTHELYFADQNWKKPNKLKYFEYVERYRPKLATVLDLERPEQFDEVLDWADTISFFVEEVIIIPKFSGSIKSIPKKINSANVRLGYSVPTKFGATTVPIEEFEDWPIHLLGGSPQAQMKLINELNVKSADGNMMLKMASRCFFWVKSAKHRKNGAPDFTTFTKHDGEKWNGSNPTHEAFRRSCVNIMSAWEDIVHINKYKEEK